LKTEHTIYFQDSRDLSNIPDNSVHLIITSNPYWNRKDYGHENQIGFGQTYEEFLNDLECVWSECYRILHPGCKMCINVGDYYCSTKEFGRYKIISIESDITLACESIGFDLVSRIIWQKICRSNPSGGCNLMGSIYYPRNGIVKLDFEHILIFKKLGKAPKISKEIKEQSKLTLKEWTKYFTGHWKFPGTRNKDHPASFPLELPKRLIKMYSFVGETVFDPFLGSGKTSLAALLLNRNSIACEINKKEYWPVIKKNFGLFFYNSDYKFIIKDRKTGVSRSE
jgi:site-specific DNA-methyltransferase (adenine-specific)